MSAKKVTITSALVACGAALIVVLPAAAQNASEHDAHHPTQAQAPTPEQLTEGEVRKVDRDAGKITLKHGPIANLSMPPMTMVFLAQDPALLKDVKAGDKVRFRVEQIGGQYTVTRIERQQ
jgi:Cu/Ag efflux protein CusF